MIRATDAEKLLTAQTFGIELPVDATLARRHAMHFEPPGGSSVNQISASEMQVRAVIVKLDLKPHPEGGSYREIYRSRDRVHTARGVRSAITTIYYLLERNQIGRWHVVEADEIWHFYEGSPLELFAYAPEGHALVRNVLGDTRDNHERVAVIRKGSGRQPVAWETFLWWAAA